MKHKGMRLGAGILAACALAGASGCGGTETPPKTSPSATVWEATPPTTTDISSLLTADEVSQAVGVTMEAGTLYDAGGTLAFHSTDYQTQVSLLVEKPEGDIAAYFASVTENYAPEDLVMAPNLGDEAYWCASTGELLVKSGAYLVSVNITRPEFSADGVLIAARQLAALAIERLPE